MELPPCTCVGGLHNDNELNCSQNTGRYMFRELHGNISARTALECYFPFCLCVICWFFFLGPTSYESIVEQANSNAAHSRELKSASFSRHAFTYGRGDVVVWHPHEKYTDKLQSAVGLAVIAQRTTDTMYMVVFKNENTMYLITDRLDTHHIKPKPTLLPDDLREIKSFIENLQPSSSSGEVDLSAMIATFNVKEVTWEEATKIYHSTQFSDTCRCGSRNKGKSTINCHAKGRKGAVLCCCLAKGFYCTSACHGESEGSCNNRNPHPAD